MHMDRRQFVKNLGLGTASLSMGSLVTASSCAPSGDSSLKQNVKEGEDGQFLFIGDDIAIAQTEYGKVQGYLLNLYIRSWGFLMGLIRREKIALCLPKSQSRGQM